MERRVHVTHLAGKVALVTGGSRGIGAAIAARLAQDGADVALTYLSAGEKAKAVVAAIEEDGRRALAVQADSGDGAAVVAAVERVVAEFGRLDILVNNAGVFPYASIEEVSTEEVDRTLAVHVRGVYLATQAAVRRMGDGGRVISIGSCFAERVPYAGVSLYAMSKSALVGMTRGLARDLGPRGITVNVVHPGSTDTDMNPASGDGADHERSFIALGHYAEPADVAATVSHLAGPGGRYITGASIAVDGGFAA
ncbi:MULTISPECIES: SDR family NAD(P)-dependent oxidoreductase [unclassified Micromonospora]|uniref:SDR family NAD(P)-dependent oxidoreductase n=1 Tax=unclassified Micromonospora TaxID=2617518 RepID=UPI0011D9F36B|nr:MULTISPECIES: SDR family oxidoreductase [unclassified Micromonospora]TYC13419.1 SDR family oxidoreductase [Micromonospora sp. MP36]